MYSVCTLLCDASSPGTPVSEYAMVADQTGIVAAARSGTNSGKSKGVVLKNLPLGGSKGIRLSASFHFAETKGLQRLVQLNRQQKF